jgi:hypothetical protein
MRIRLAFFAVASLLAVSACKEAPPSNAMFDDGNNANDVPPPLNISDSYVPAPAPVENVTNTLPAAPPPAFTDKQQINDDADASGMTARLPDAPPYPTDEGTQPAANSAQSAQ